MPIVVGAALVAIGRWVVFLLVEYGGRIVVNVLLYMGIRLFTAKVANTFMHSTFAALFGGLPAQLGQVVGYLKADVAVSIVLSAVVFRMTRDTALRLALKNAPGT